MNLDNTQQAPSTLNAAASSRLNTTSSRLNTPSSTLNTLCSQLDTPSSASNFVSALLDGAFSGSKPSASIMAFSTLILLDDAKTPDEFWALRSCIRETLQDLAALAPVPELDIKAMVAELLPGVVAKVLASEKFKDRLEDLRSSYGHEGSAELEASEQPLQATPGALDSDADIPNSEEEEEESGDDSDYILDSSAGPAATRWET
ncbi:hypothetical protein EXIGLDRAFT_760143 [Exidia glandulosa HHB12029]|uniref:Uncharacterized protein n=1 Tax=Exidia glandulosa HHB12029 TaxID=1314781 RepID=A0A165PKM2_EXIGL|nr:hypothetical protein EXIGLDRAFT_760143 [Exidia glandulosa HHB12029]